MNDLITLLQAHISDMGYRFDWKEFILGVATPLFIAALLIEMWLLRHRPELFKLKEIVVNFSLGFSYQAMEVILHFLFIGALLHWISGYALFTLEMNWLALILGFLGMEFLYYWYHRANHRIRYFWCSHVVHHSSEGMNMSTATRQSMTYAISGGVVIFFSPLMLLGYPPELVMVFYAIDLFYQYFIHTQSIDKLPKPIEYFFNTPSHHRVHHGRNPEYIDKNYGGMVIIFDRLFGTFAAEDAKNNPVDYGIVKQIHSNNILTINFHEWIDMFKAALAPGNIRQRVKHIWAPPEWERSTADSK